MDWAEVVSILVAVIAAAGAFAAQKSAANATKAVAETSGRLESEKEAYERARGFDIQTIERQSNELKLALETNQKLREENAEIIEVNTALLMQLSRIRIRLRRLEVLFPEIKEHIVDLEDDSDEPSSPSSN